VLDFSLDKIVVIAVIAALVVGPAKLPEYAARLARLVRSFRGMVDGAQSRMRDELGPDFSEIDWKKLDPRQYDPRQIIRDSLMSDPTPVADLPERVPNPFDDLVVQASDEHRNATTPDPPAASKKKAGKPRSTPQFVPLNPPDTRT